MNARTGYDGSIIWWWWVPHPPGVIILTTPYTFFYLLAQCHVSIYPAFVSGLIIALFTWGQTKQNHNNGIKSTCIINSQTAAGSTKEPFDYTLTTNRTRIWPTCNCWLSKYLCQLNKNTPASALSGLQWLRGACRHLFFSMFGWESSM